MHRPHIDDGLKGQIACLAGRTALVTGASGFMGAALARGLCEAGGTVIGVSREAREPDGACQAWWQSDLADPAEVDGILAATRPDVVFHLASHVSGARGIDNVLPMLRANLLSTVNLLVAAAKQGCARLVLAGSMEEPPGGEERWPVPGSPYAAAKLAAGAYGRMFHALYGVPCVTLRLFMVYGPGQLDLHKLVPHVVNSLLRGTPPAVSSGVRRVDWVYVEDVVQALLAAGAAPGIDGRTIDVGSGALVTVREVVERLARIVGAGVEPSFGAVPDRPLEAERVADVTQAAACLDWRARTPLDVGLSRTVDWYRLHLRTSP